MANTKTYQLCDGKFFWSTYINVNGSPVRVVFDGGIRQPRFIPGSFITSDPNIQKSLEGSQRFNKVYKLVNSEKSKPKEKAGKESPTIYDQVKVVNDARDILVQNHGATPDDLKNKGLVLKFAEGVNVQFPNLNG